MNKRLLYFLSICFVLLNLLSCKTSSYEVLGGEEKGGLTMSNENTETGERTERQTERRTVNRIDTNLVAIYGDTTLDIIMHSTTIKAYHIDWNNEDTTREKLLDYPIISQKDSISGDQSDALKRLLFRKANYWIGSENKRCEFAPSLAFTFYKDNQKVQLLFDFSCDVLQIIKGDTQKIANFDHGHKRFVKLGNVIFNNVYQNYLANIEDGNDSDN